MSSSAFLDSSLADIAKYNRARNELESFFVGLPHAHTTLIKSLITKANPETGIVENISYKDLTFLLMVDAAPGRKDSGTPQKQTIRSYLRTIEAQSRSQFHVISDSQTLKIQFPKLPSIYAKYFEITEVHTDLNAVSYTPTSLINTEKNISSEVKLNIEEYIEPYTQEYTLKSEDVFNAHEYTHAKIKQNPTKPNNNKNFVSDDFADCKKPIADDFYPSQSVIDKALELGLPKVKDLAELNKFILFNKASGSRWANYDYVYLKWLQRDAERERAKTMAQKSNVNSQFKKISTSTGSTHYCVQSNASKCRVKQRVIDAWSEDGLDYCEHTNRFYARGTTPDYFAASDELKYIDIDSLGPID